jgi:hypothetical protein
MLTIRLRSMLRKLTPLDYYKIRFLHSQCTTILPKTYFFQRNNKQRSHVCIITCIRSLESVNRRLSLWKFLVVEQGDFFVEDAAVYGLYGFQFKAARPLCEK